MDVIEADGMVVTLECGMVVTLESTRASLKAAYLVVVRGKLLVELKAFLKEYEKVSEMEMMLVVVMETS